MQEARRGPGSVAAGGARAVRQHGARQADGGDSEGVHAGMPVLPTRHAHEAREGRPAGEGGTGGGEGDEGDGVQRILAAVAQLQRLPRVTKRGAGD